ncbi:hypothetical protein MMC24_002863 [Lignoscripta atroalba]|nr:hypothetical protein [Lignoscripta atroalba]
MQEPNQGNHIQANQANPSSSPKLKLQWCCLQPTYSGAGGIAFVSAGMDADRSSRIRTAPLPRGKGWEDSEFARLRQDDDSFPKAAYGRVEAPDYTLKNGHDQVLHWLLYGPGNSDEPGCPRNLCQECYETKGWQAACQACRVPFCFQHDFRGLKMRICGYRDLHVEKAQLQEKENILAKEALVEEALAKRTQAEQSGYHSPVIQRIRELLVETSNPEDSTMQQVASLTPLPNTHDLLDVRDSTDDQAYDTDTSDNSTSQLDYLIKCDQEAHAKVKQCEPQWHGCASFLCPEYRSVGDHRPKCTAVAKICTVCSVHVCPECLVKSPPCDCSFCVAQYRCPNCFVKTRGSVCRKADEDRQAREKAKLQELRKALYKLSKERADNVAGQAGEFFARVEATPNERCHEVAEQIGESSSRLEASHEDIADSAAEQVGEFFAAVEGWNLG